jgi:lipopolysaccharide export LptBFGC system permease protein LptF
MGASDPQPILEKLDSLEKAISNLSFRILALEKRFITLEERFFLEATKPEKQMGITPESAEQSGDDFSIEDVTCETQYNGTIFRGQITNNTNNDFQYSLFKITVYKKDGSIASSNDFYILNLDRHSTRAFETKIHDAKKEEFERYLIEFTKGS